MKKCLTLAFLLVTITSCFEPERRNWIIPLTLDISDLNYTPGERESFATRRQQMLDSMNGGILILKCTDPMSYNRHEFRPNNYFLYLSGYSAPGSTLFLGAIKDGPFLMVMPYTNTRKMIYMGGDEDPDSLQARIRADRVLEFNEGRLLLDSVLDSGTPLYADLGNQDLRNELLQRLGSGGMQMVRDARPILDELRVIKDRMEVELIQKACNITAKSFFEVLNECEPGMYEFEIESLIEGTFLKYGSAMPGFASIVASGPNSTILHYEHNKDLMEDGDLLLMDIGAEYGWYTADMTRTIPVNGKFSPEQATIYNLVLEAQKAGIEALVPGNGFADGHLAATKVLVEGLVKLGLITDPDSPWQIRFHILYPASHYLGMNVHDVGNMGGSFTGFRAASHQGSIKSRTLEPGMVLTIEPGLYFREKGLDQIYTMFAGEADSSEIAAFVEEIRPQYEKYLNIGVRIEDDILITRQGNINLSRYAPRELKDIEQLMR
jgi:Xaa-Pro aminopeptidase